MTCLCALLAVLTTFSLINALDPACQPKNEYNDQPPEYCELPNQPHLGCNNNNQFSAACGQDAEILPMNANFKDHIVRQHNVYRNVVARGTHHILPVASRMLTLKWDANLAQLAEYAVRLCSIKRLSQSFATTEASDPGFNAAYSKFPLDQYQNEHIVLTSQLKAWFDEYRYLSPESLASNKSSAGQDVSHITQMIIGPNDRVGCAIVRYTKEKFRYQLMICLYGCFKGQRKMTYDLGKVPAEKCFCGSDRKFKNLCSSGESRGDCALLTDSNLELDNIEPSTTTTRRPTTTKKPNKECGLQNIFDWIFQNYVKL